ncbi:hypothetical protein [Spirosoma daeguense]
MVLLRSKAVLFRYVTAFERSLLLRLSILYYQTFRYVVNTWLFLRTDTSPATFSQG